MNLSCPLLALLFSVFIFYFEKSQHIFLIPLIQMLKVVEQQLLVMSPRALNFLLCCGSLTYAMNALRSAGGSCSSMEGGFLAKSELIL